ncbi:MAG: DNA-formamidopyrimidine glycosylase family protein [Lutispora sp.]|jgi:formamidopyrimidine-DNA glycosylase|uniref:DNA-formamidopyrimidine glycosylase family protein n=1 Tax=Lutispora sp. TaxID=2828727 RepID=UPI003566D47E
MIELPEAKVIARQINETLKGKRIDRVVASHTPHKFAWYFEDPKDYQKLLAGKHIDGSTSFGGFIEISAEDCRILLGEGVRIKYYEKGEKLPAKHQLMITFDDGSSMSCSVQMYGGMWCFREGEYQNPYYKVAKEKPSPYSEEFNEDYFLSMMDENTKGLSLKAFLATQQRIPGLGNGVLQDILWNAKLHPKRKMNSLGEEDLINLFKSIESTIREMAEKGGRDTEKDFFGINGGYKTVMSSKNAGMPCPACGNVINKEAYLGGSIYYCNECQLFNK